MRSRRTAGSNRSRRWGVGWRADPGGEDVDVMLDSLIRVISMGIGEPTAVIGVVAQPVAGESVGKPGTPADDETLRQIDVDKFSADVDRCDHHEGHDGDPEPADTRLADHFVTGAEAFEGHLQRGVEVVAEVTQQDVEPNRDQGGEQHHTQPHPHHNACATAEIAAGDPPELPAPGGEAGQQNQHDHRHRRSDQPGPAGPQQGLWNLVRPVQRGRVGLHADSLQPAELDRHRRGALDLPESPFTLAE